MNQLITLAALLLLLQPAQAKTCGTDLLNPQMASLVEEALVQTFDKMDTPYTNPTKLELYEVLKVCETPPQGQKQGEAEVHLDIIYSEVYVDEGDEASIEITSCQIYMEYESDESLWYTSEVICDNDFGWVP